MSETALVLGGTGLIGRALVPEMLARGWNLTVASRTLLPADVPWSDEVEHVQFDRDKQSLQDIVSEYNAFIDIVAYEPSAARQLIDIQDRVGTFVVISSMSVYADKQGRPMDEAERPEDFPHFPKAIPETERTVAPSSATYSTKKAAIEQTLLADLRIPVTILRPGMIYGPGDKASREWFFVKRVRDRRNKLILAYRGATPVSVIASRNLADLICLAVETPGTRVINAADPEPQTAHKIGHAIGDLLDHKWDEVLIDGPSPREPIGDTPWSAPRPFVVDITKSQTELGYQGSTTHADALRETCEWLVAATTDRDWMQILPNAHKYYGSLFDYAAEDAFLATAR